jgi:two-component system response regulator NreC
MRVAAASAWAIAQVGHFSPQFMRPSAARPLGTDPDARTGTSERSSNSQMRSELPWARGYETTPLADHAVDVMLIDRRPLMREGLRALIERESGLAVVAQAATVRDARGVHVAPDVIVTSTDLPDARDVDLIGGLREFFQQQSSILVFAPIVDHVEVGSVFAAGADGYLLETADSTDLLAGIRAVAAGEIYLQPSLGATLARSHRAADSTLELTPQEKRVLRLLVLGHTNVEIARLCHTSLRTSETHRANIQRKLDRRTRAELVEYALETGLVQLVPE